MEPWEVAYRKWLRLADRGYGPRCFTPQSMERVDARIRRAKENYERLLKEHKALLAIRTQTKGE